MKNKKKAISKTPGPNLKIKASENKAPAVETKEPDNFLALQYIDTLMQKAPGTRREHITAQQAIQQVEQALQGLKKVPMLLQRIELLDKEITTGLKSCDKLQKQIDKLEKKLKAEK